MNTFLAVLLSLISLFLILLILVQRGRGGGLAGALGGMGGQSAFGSKAGDSFTRITIVVAGIWILTAIIIVRWLNTAASVFDDDSTAATPPRATAPAEGPTGTGLGPSTSGTPSGVTTGTGAPNNDAPNNDAPNNGAPNNGTGSTSAGNAGLEAPTSSDLSSPAASGGTSTETPEATAESPTAGESVPPSTSNPPAESNPTSEN